MSRPSDGQAEGVGRRYRYPVKSLRGDYFRAGAGLALCTLPLIFAPPFGGVFLVFGGLAVMFAVYGLRAWAWQMTVVDVTETVVSVAGPRIISGRLASRVSLAWDEVRAVKLSYYSTKRERTDGWMNLKLKGAGESLIVGSEIDGFSAIAAKAAAVAKVNSVPLSEATVSNFAVLGITVSATRTPEPDE
jgi:hypothetical protein